MKKKINVCLIGCGYWANNIVNTLKKLSHLCELKLICDINAKNLSYFAKVNNLHNTNQITNIDQIAHYDIDTCFIVTPIKTHFVIIKKLSNKYNLFVEKPICYTAKEIIEINKINKISSYLIFTGHIYFYNKNIDFFISKIKKSKNKILSLTSTRTNLGRIQTDINSLWSFASHDLTIAYKVLKELPLSVSCIGVNFINKIYKDSVFIILNYKSGKKVTLNLGWYNPNKIRETVVITKDKIFIYDDVSDDKRVTIDNTKIIDFNKRLLNNQNKALKIYQGKRKSYKKMNDDPLKNEIKYFFDLCHKKIRDKNEFQLSLNFTSIMIAAEKSLLRSGATVKIKYYG